VPSWTMLASAAGRTESPASLSPTTRGALWDRRWAGLPVPMCGTDAEGRIFGFNRRAIELWGREPAVGESVDPFFARNQQEERARGVSESPVAFVLRTGVPLHGKETMVVREDGRRLACMVHIDPVEDEDGRRIGTVGCFIDVTERKRSQDKLAERERWFRELLEALPTAIYTTDAQGRVTFFNQAAMDFAGHRPVLGSDEWCVTAKLYTADGRPLPHDQCPMALALKEERPVRGVQAIAERPDGTRVPFLPYPTPLFDDEGNLLGAVNVLVDLSEPKAAEQRLELLASEVDHRAKNILAVVQAAVQLTRGDDLDHFRTALQGRIDALARAHSSLANNRWKGASLNELVDEELAAFPGRTTAHGPSLLLQPAAAQSIAMALHELATNAAKYGALSSTEGALRVTWSFDAARGLSLRWVKRGGPPVRAPKRAEPRARDGGIGTSLIERMLRQHGGAARFDWYREGLECELSLPAEQLRDPAAVANTAETELA